VPFLVISCCLYASNWGGRIGLIVCGILLALAASAHLYAVFALLLLSPWFLGSRWGNFSALFLPLCWVALGFFATFIAGWLWYWATWGMPAFFSPTLEVLRDLGNGGAAQWKKPLEVALRLTPSWLAPAVILVPVVGASIRGRALMRGAALSLLVSLSFFWGGDLFGKAYVLSMPFYYSFLLPVATLAAATLCGELLISQPERVSRISLFFGFVVALVMPLVHVGIFTGVPLILWCVAPILTLLPAWSKLQRRFLASASVLAISVSGFLVASTEISSWVVKSYPRKDIPVLELATSLRQELPRAADDPKVMRFWYDDDLAKPGGGDRQMIASFWLHWFGKLRSEGDQVVPFPEMSEAQALSIAHSAGVDRVVIFDQDPNVVAKGLEVFKLRKLPFHVAKRIQLRAPSDPARTLDVALLERTPPSNVLSTEPWDTRNIKIVPHGTINNQGGAIEVTSGRVRWQEFARLPLGQLKKGEAVRLRFRIVNGMVRFSLHGDQ
jgi:hypothetical protein